MARINQKNKQVFRKGYGTIDHVHVLNQLKEKCGNYNLPLRLTFVNYEKAFDWVETDDILESLVEQGVDTEYVNIFKDIYTNCSATIKLGSDSTKSIIAKGVRQGDIISPKLFTTCLERVFKGIDWSQSGVAIDGESLNHLRFADDIVLISKTLQQTEEMLQQLNTNSKKCGLHINWEKTKTMINPNIKPEIVKMENKEIVESYVYLGQSISLQQPSQELEINRRV